MPRKLSFSNNHNAATAATIIPTDEAASKSNNNNSNNTANNKLWKAVYYCCGNPMKGESLLHQSNNFNLSLVKAFMERCPSDLLQDFLLQTNVESGYTPLHSAIANRNFAAVLLLLRHAMHISTNEEEGSMQYYYHHDVSGQGKQRLVWRPMAVLAGSVSIVANSPGSVGRDAKSAKSNILDLMIKAKDSEGFTPMQLLVQQQSNYLSKCRQALEIMAAGGYDVSRSNNTANNSQSQRRLTFSADHQDGMNQQEDDEDTLNLAFSALRQQQHQPPEMQEVTDDENSQSIMHIRGEHFACEVMTFGRARHHALGVVEQGVSSSESAASTSSNNTASVSTQRVQEFAYERVGKEGSAVAVAAATHHTLVVTQQGHVLSFGLSGKNGRLGLGDSVREAFLPSRVMGPLSRLKVMAVAAAENHSLCVTRNEGWVFAWGSNRFGQLGIGNSSSASNISSTESSASANSRWIPRRVEENNMKQVPCLAVAAGEKHSVALSRQGGVYVWGDNTSGQLGVSMGRTGILLKPQKVPALATKFIIRIAAAEQSTLALAKPAPGMATNTVYQWGHGNHVPYKVPFDMKNRNEETADMSSSRHVINPVEIACAKHHNVAITSVGHVYTWGLHAEPLGRSTSAGDTNSKKFARPRSSSFNKSMSSPQLVQGMLPEKGGGIAVALAASEERTAVLTESGTLFTWGATHGKHVLGHEGVRWQPIPKQVPGVHRAVKIALAKEHTVLLVGASFPPLRKEKKPNAEPASLEFLTARKVAQHVDLFNVVPILIMAERTECACLVEYCTEFVRRNFDAVLNLARKREMDCYLDDMISESLHHPGVRFRDDSHHPVIMDLLTAGRVSSRATFERDWMASHEEWLLGCEALAEIREVRHLVERSMRIEEVQERSRLVNKRNHANSFSGDYETKPRARSISNASDADARSSLAANSKTRRDSYHDTFEMKKAANLDMSTVLSAEGSSEWVSKEIRGLKKKLSQISRLEKSESNTLSEEQQVKVNRRSFLEAELCRYEETLKEIRDRIEAMKLEEVNKARNAENDTSGITPEKGGKQPAGSVADKSDPADADPCKSYTCEVCRIKCPDKKSFELHKNGRKHRNKISQVAQEEEKAAAASIVETFQIQQMKAGSKETVKAPEPIIKKAWNASNTKPMYKLPPPPHPAVAPVHSLSQNPASPAINRALKIQNSPPSQCTPTSFREIVEEQTKKSSSEKSESRIAFMASPGKPSPSLGTGPNLSKYLPKDLPPAPTLRNAAWASEKPTDRASYALADFLTPQNPSPSKQKSISATWASPKTPPVPTSPMKSFREIEEEEIEFVNKKQDSAYGRGGGTWFIERRERADSLTAIQVATEKSREEQLFIEEQHRIEAQIMKELELQRKKSQAPSNQQRSKKRQQKKGNDNQTKPQQANSKGRKGRGGRKASSENAEKQPNPNSTCTSPRPNANDTKPKPKNAGRRRKNAPRKNNKQPEP